MRDPREIILAPILTEKALRVREKYNEYIFKVAKDANKIEIKKAIEALFRVTILDVTTINVKPKPRRLGRFSGYTSRWKKAIVKLKPGDKIAAFEV